MLELAGRISFGMDIGDLLELECAFHGDRKMRATAEEQRVLFVTKNLGHFSDRIFHSQCRFKGAGQGANLVHHVGLKPRVEAMAAREHQRQQQ